MKAHATRTSFALIALAMVVSACSKSTPTQIIVEVGGDAGFAEVAVEVEGEERARTSLPTNDGEDLPLTLTLVHGGGGLGPIAVSAVGYSAAGAATARDCSLVSFRRGAITEVELSVVDGVMNACDAEPKIDGGVLPDAGPSCDPVACAATDASAVCVDGRCVIQSCPSHRADCNPDVPGCETSTRTDPLNCGACGNVCPMGARCRGGGC
jgi:hypothetical protein